MLNAIKDILFHTLVILGLVTLIATVFWCFIEVLNKIFKYTRYIIMYQEYKRNKEMCDLKNKIVVSKDGCILYSCIYDLDEKIQTLKKAIEKCEEKKELQKKYEYKENG